MTTQQYIETCVSASSFAAREAKAEAAKGNTHEALNWLDTAIADLMCARKEIKMGRVS